MKSKLFLACIILIIVVSSCEERREVKKNGTTIAGNNKEVDTVKPPQLGAVAMAGGNAENITDNMSDEEKKQFMIGSWFLEFPTPDINWGHIFYADQTYKYCDYSREAKMARFISLDGEWKINGNVIEVRILAINRSDRNPEKKDSLLVFPQDAKVIKEHVDSDKWEEIGTMKSIKANINIDDIEFPPQISLRSFNDSGMIGEEKKYFHISGKGVRD